MSAQTMDGVPKLDIDQYVSPLEINGLSGRVMHLPAPKNRTREILLVHGHHASLERMYGLAKALNRYGGVTAPDMPGFGGMDSFYKIGKKPDIDALAEYLAAFIKMRYKKRPFTIVGMSLGFVVVTRMLQKYPSMVGRVDLCVSAFGFTHSDDFKMPRRKKRFFAVIAGFLSMYIPSLLARAWLRKPVIRSMYNHDNTKAHSVNETEERRRYRVEFEVWLWQNNDIRTHFYTLRQMLTLNLCNAKVAMPVHHAAVTNDQYFDNHTVEQHMRVIYSDFTSMPLRNTRVHAPTILANAQEAGVYIPPKLRAIFNKK